MTNLELVQEALDTLKLHVMLALNQVPYPGWCFNLTALQDRTQLPIELIRALVAELRNEGLAEFQKGLWSEDNKPAGSGYCLTDAGRQYLISKSA